jgi:hypothetical protein
MGAINIDELPHYTYDDYLLWQGDWELINGILYARIPAPTVEHQRISASVNRLRSVWVKL